LASKTSAFREHARTAYYASPGAAVVRDEGFTVAQWALQTDAAAAVAQMGARFAAGEGALAGLVRGRQDMLGLREATDKRLLAATAAGSTVDENTLREEVSAIDQKLDAIDAQLAKDFPDYAALANPKPLSIAEVQGLLGSDEALVQILDIPQLNNVNEESLIWVVTKTESRWARSELGTAALTREVAALRCGLDLAALEQGPVCSKLLGLSTTALNLGPGKPLPFDLGRAHALFESLFGEVEDLIKDKNLVIVPSGALTRLPFQVLVTQAPDSSVAGTQALRKAHWLIRDHALTVLPSVASLKVLRGQTGASRAPLSMIAFGNPVVEGDEKPGFEDSTVLLGNEAT
jgi:hypothetical protein